MKSIKKMSADSLKWHIEKWESKARCLKAMRKKDELEQVEKELSALREELRGRPNICIMRKRTDDPCGNRSY